MKINDNTAYEEVKENTDKCIHIMPATTDLTDQYCDQIWETHVNNTTKLREIENERMIKQNEKERSHETGNSCFDTVLKGSKVFQKSIKENK